MTAHSLLHKLHPYQGCRLTKCIDGIESAAQAAGYTVNVMDPEFNIRSIDNEPKRLNVRSDRHGIVTSFSIG